MNYYLTMKRNQILTFGAKLMQLEIIILSEINQTQKHKFHIFFFCHVEVAVFKNKSVWMPCFFDNKLMFLLNNIPYIIMYYLFSFVLIFVTKVMGVAGPCGPPGRVKQFRVGDGGKGVR